MLGFYPVTPGVPTYELGSPVFDRVTIQLHNGKEFRLIAKDTSVNNKYIESVRFNGQQQDRVWFRHSDILDGLTVELNMADTPNQTIGSSPESLPPSSLDLDPNTLQETIAKTAMTSGSK